MGVPEARPRGVSEALAGSGASAWLARCRLRRGARHRHLHRLVVVALRALDAVAPFVAGHTPAFGTRLLVGRFGVLLVVARGGRRLRAARQRVDVAARGGGRGQRTGCESGQRGAEQEGGEGHTTPRANPVPGNIDCRFRVPRLTSKETHMASGPL